MTNEVDHWRKFWGDKTDPLHSHNDKEYYESYGNELAVLLPPKVSAVLELGCGSGSLYEPLGFNNASSYVGIDLSKSMLDKFHASYPSLSLYEGSADTYKDENSYDLIFTNGVIQYLSTDMLRKQIRNALEMLTDDGLIVHSSIPWNIMKKQYIKGNLMPPYNTRGIKATLLYWATKLGLKKDTMGRWYSIKDFENIAKEFDLNAKFYGSIYYPYRFHVKLKRV